MGNPAIEALSFVIGTLLSLYAMVCAVRFIMQAVGVSGYGPIAQFVIKATDPLLAPMRKVIPQFRGYNLAALLLCFLVLLIKALFFKVLAQSDVLAGYRIGVQTLAIPGLLTFAVLATINLFFNIFIYSIVILALLSWFSPDPNNPMIQLLQSLTHPVLRHVRRFVPPVGGLDLSSLLAIVGLFAIKIMVMGTLIGIFLR